MIKSFPTPAAYAAAGAPVDESRVAQIQSTGEIKIDGVNVLMDRPADICAVFEDPNGVAYYVRWDTIQKDRLSADWTHVGYAFNFDGKRAKVLDKNFPAATYKWLNCWQYAITAISAASIKFWLHMKGDYAVWVPIEVTLSDDTDGYINETTATEITAALEAAGNSGNVGYATWATLTTATGPSWTVTISRSSATSARTIASTSAATARTPWWVARWPCPSGATCRPAPTSGGRTAARPTGAS